MIACALIDADIKLLSLKKERWAKGTVVSFGRKGFAVLECRAI